MAKARNSASVRATTRSTSSQGKVHIQCDATCHIPTFQRTNALCPWHGKASACAASCSPPSQGKAHTQCDATPAASQHNRQLRTKTLPVENKCSCCNPEPTCQGKALIQCDATLCISTCQQTTALPMARQAPVLHSAAHEGRGKKHTPSAMPHPLHLNMPADYIIA